MFWTLFCFMLTEQPLFGQVSRYQQCLWHCTTKKLSFLFILHRAKELYVRPRLQPIIVTRLTNDLGFFLFTLVERLGRDKISATTHKQYECGVVYFI